MGKQYFLNQSQFDELMAELDVSPFIEKGDLYYTDDYIVGTLDGTYLDLNAVCQNLYGTTFADKFSERKMATDSTCTAIAYLSDSDIHNNGETVSFLSSTLDEQFSIAGNTISFTGEADQIEVSVSIFAEKGAGSQNYWARPSIRVKDGSGQVIGQMDSLAMNQNTAYSGNVSITGSILIKNPENTQYTFEWFDADNRVATLSPIPASHVAVKATKKIEVLVQ